MAGSTIIAHKGYEGDMMKKESMIDNSSGGAIIPEEMLIGVNNNSSKGYELMMAMGFKDRGHSKFCFKSYDDDT